MELQIRLGGGRIAHTAECDVTHVVVTAAGPEPTLRSVEPSLHFDRTQARAHTYVYDVESSAPGHAASSGSPLGSFQAIQTSTHLESLQYRTALPSGPRGMHEACCAPSAAGAAFRPGVGALNGGNSGTCRHVALRALADGVQKGRVPVVGCRRVTLIWRCLPVAHRVVQPVVHRGEQSVVHSVVQLVVHRGVQSVVLCTLMYCQWCSASVL